jgi:hypothetical protein
MLNNYYKSRNIVNDNFFNSDDSRKEAGDDVSVAVTGMLIRQAINLLSKDNIQFTGLNEVEAIFHLLRPHERQQLKDKINSLDGRQKKNANNIIRDIERRM